MRRALHVAIVCVALALGASAAAQDTTGDRATSFQAVSGSAHEDVPGGNLLVMAYAAVLALVGAYVGRIARMQKANADEITRIEKLLETKTGKKD